MPRVDAVLRGVWIDLLLELCLVLPRPPEMMNDICSLSDVKDSVSPVRDNMLRHIASVD